MSVNLLEPLTIAIEGTPAFPDGCDVFRIGRCAEGWQEGQVDAERLVRHVVAARDFPGEQIRRLLRQAGNNAEATRVRDRGGEFGKPDIMHSALDNRMFDAEHFSDCCSQEWLPSVCRILDQWTISGRPATTSRRRVGFPARTSRRCVAADRAASRIPRRRTAASGDRGYRGPPAPAPPAAADAPIRCRRRSR